MPQTKEIPVPSTKPSNTKIIEISTSIKNRKLKLFISRKPCDRQFLKSLDFPVSKTKSTNELQQEKTVYIDKLQSIIMKIKKTLAIV